MRRHQVARQRADRRKRVMEPRLPSHRWLAISSLIVAAVAMVLRLPSCYESFWVDELHSAWTVWGNLSDVLPRADMGHQSPFYFIGLWFWKQIVGGSEVALRLSSVLAIAAACIVLNVGVAQWTRSAIAGVAASMLLATESNSLFFGTELRPYAMVILFSSVALVFFVHLMKVPSRHDDRRSWVIMIAAILLAVLCQPTAIGVLGWLPLTLLVVWVIRDRRQFVTFSLSDGFLILSASAVLFALWRVTLGESWNQRTIWSSFAKATHVNQMWEVWDWTFLIIVPLGLGLLAVIIHWTRKGTASDVRELSIATWLLAAIAILATGIYWAFSFADWMPVWHRRYFIAVLPIFAVVTGGAIGTLQIALKPTELLSYSLTTVVALALMFVLPYQQGTISKLDSYPVALVVRGEDWRGAVEWVRAHVEPNDLVMLDAGLIEATAWLAPIKPGATVVPMNARSSGKGAQREREYLVFATSGPYDLNRNVIPVRADASAGLVFNSNQAKRRLYWITRRPVHQVNVDLPFGSQVVGFGNVSVARQSSKLDRSF